MATLSEYFQQDDEEDLAALSFFSVVTIVTLWVIVGLYIGRPFTILDTICGIGILVAVIGIYATITRRLQRLEQELAYLRAAVRADLGGSGHPDDNGYRVR